MVNKMIFMKRWLLGILLLEMMIPMISHGQTPDTMVYLRSRNLQLSEHETTVLVFPATITSVDRGTPEILARKASGTQNVLELKAARKDFAATNLNVITSDGQLYSFDLEYCDHPAHLAFRFNSLPMIAQGALIRVDHPSVAKEILTTEMIRVHDFPRELSSVCGRAAGILIRLFGVYTAHDILYFQVAIRNRSLISFNPGGPVFTLKDSRKVKRKAMQDRRIDALMVYGMPERITGLGTDTVVFALPKFSVSRDKYLNLSIPEYEGSREPGLRVPATRLLHCMPLAQTDQ
jgi:conjugative transposon TraN protein